MCSLHCATCNILCKSICIKDVSQNSRRICKTKQCYFSEIMCSPHSAAYKHSEIIHAWKIDLKVSAKSSFPFQALVSIWGTSSEVLVPAPNSNSSDPLPTLIKITSHWRTFSFPSSQTPVPQGIYTWLLTPKIPESSHHLLTCPFGHRECSHNIPYIIAAPRR